MDKNTQKLGMVLIEKAGKALNKNGFEDVRVFENRKEAVKAALDLIPEGKTVGLGGSQTVRETGILEELEKKCAVVTHKPGMDIKQRREIWKKAASSDFYLASPQAITQDGKLFFLDKYGNRLSAIIFGPSRVVLMAGHNKIVKDEKEACARSWDVAAVKNNLRLDTKNPCTKTGVCEDCSSENRICNIYLGMYKKPPATDYSIFLINEELGY